MKVLLLHRNSFDKIGGVETTIKAMAETLTAMGHSVYICAHAVGTGANEEKTDIATIVRLKNVVPPKLLIMFSPTFDYVGNRNAIKKTIDRINPDVVIVRDNVYAYLISKMFPLEKIVYIPLGIIGNYKNVPRKCESVKEMLIEMIRRIQMHQFDFYQRCGLKRVNTVVFSETMRKQVLQLFSTKENLYQHYPGVDAKYYKNTSDLEENSESKEQGKMLLFVGRLAQVKNIQMLIEAFSKVQYPNVQLVLVGDGEEKKRLIGLVNSLGLENRVRFVGASRECEKYYNCATYSVLTSFYESYGNVIAESLISGTPVVALSSELEETQTATNELIQNGNNGFLCNSFSVNELAKTMEYALEFSDTKEYSLMRERCKQNALEQFSWYKFLEFCLERPWLK